MKNELSLRTNHNVFEGALIHSAITEFQWKCEVFAYSWTLFDTFDVETVPKEVFPRLISNDYEVCSRSTSAITSYRTVFEVCADWGSMLL